MSPTRRMLLKAVAAAALAAKLPDVAAASETTITRSGTGLMLLSLFKGEAPGDVKDASRDDDYLGMTSDILILTEFSDGTATLEFTTCGAGDDPRFRRTVRLDAATAHAIWDAVFFPDRDEALAIARAPLAKKP